MRVARTMTRAKILRQHSTRREVVTYTVGDDGAPEGHEASTRAEIARRLAELAGFEFSGKFDPRARYDERPYFVPSDTLTSATAAELRIDDAHDLFGGVVPTPFAARKTITHPLVGDRAHAPDGWSATFARFVADSVLPGFSAFSIRDALHAGRILLDQGAIRVKLGSGVAGIGQWVAHDASELEAIIAAIDPAEITSAGVVIEQNLTDVATKSIGNVRVGGLEASYCGVQHLTRNNGGAEVYGGSELRFVRGGFDALLSLELPTDMLLAIAQARVYDDAADASFHGFFASRRNYDVAQGADSRGQHRSGVLEPSWRVGGASGAEIAALAAFRADSSLRAVVAVSHEIYGDSEPVPESADVYFQGVDPHVGPLTKYTTIEHHADAR
jgi:uncharacterized protein DUF3182